MKQVCDTFGQNVWKGVGSHLLVLDLEVPIIRLLAAIDGLATNVARGPNLGKIKRARLCGHGTVDEADVSTRLSNPVFSEMDPDQLKQNAARFHRGQPY